DHLDDGEVVGEPRLLLGDPDQPAGRRAGRVAGQRPGRHRRRAALAQQDADRAGLARPVGAQQRHQLTRMNLEVNALQGLDLAVVLVDAPQLRDHMGVHGVSRHWRQFLPREGCDTSQPDGDRRPGHRPGGWLGSALVMNPLAWRSSPRGMRLVRVAASVWPWTDGTPSVRGCPDRTPWSQMGCWHWWLRGAPWPCWRAFPGAQIAS